MNTAAGGTYLGRYGPVDEQGICRNSVMLADGSRRRVYHKRHSPHAA